MLLAALVMSCRHWLGKSPVLVVLALTAIATLAAWLLARAAERSPRAAPSTSRHAAIVSLSPAITETLFAIGAGEQVVAVSDHCDHPVQVAELPRVGAGLSPDFERIARLAPTVIVTDRYAASQQQPLTDIAPTYPLPWLSLDDALHSIRKLGALTGRDPAATRLAGQMRSRLSVPPPADAPRVLLTYGDGSIGLRELWFVQKNSLHGAALRAAGGRNAVARDVTGTPRMSLEQLLQLDPDVIVVLDASTHAAPSAPHGLLTALRAIGELSAVREQRTGLVRAASVHAIGPRILDLIEPLAEQIRRLAR